MPKRLIDELVRRGTLSEEDGEAALTHAQSEGTSVDTAILTLGLGTEGQIVGALAAAYGLPAARSADATKPIDSSALRSFPQQWAIRHALAPLAIDPDDGSLSVLTRVPPDIGRITSLGELLELRLKPLLAPEIRVHQRLALLYEHAPPAAVTTLLQEGGGTGREAIHAPLDRNESGTHAVVAAQPVTFAEAVARVRDASNRDEIVQLALEYARRDFELAALLVVHDGRIEGWSAMGRGSIGITDVVVEPGASSAFWTAAESRAHFLGPLSEDDLARLAPLRRAPPRAGLIIPLQIRERPFALLYVENGPLAISPRLAADLMVFATHVQQAMEAVVLRRKGISASPPVDQSPDTTRVEMRAGIPDGGWGASDSVEIDVDVVTQEAPSPAVEAPAPADGPVALPKFGEDGPGPDLGLSTLVELKAGLPQQPWDSANTEHAEVPSFAPPQEQWAKSGTNVDGAERETDPGITPPDEDASTSRAGILARASEMLGAEQQALEPPPPPSLTAQHSPLLSPAMTNPAEWESMVSDNWDSWDPPPMDPPVDVSLETPTAPEPDAVDASLETPTAPEPDAVDASLETPTAPEPVEAVPPAEPPGAEARTVLELEVPDFAKLAREQADEPLEAPSRESSDPEADRAALAAEDWSTATPEAVGFEGSSTTPDTAAPSIADPDQASPAVEQDAISLEAAVGGVADAGLVAETPEPAAIEAPAPAADEDAGAASVDADTSGDDHSGPAHAEAPPSDVPDVSDDSAPDEAEAPTATEPQTETALPEPEAADEPPTEMALPEPEAAHEPPTEMALPEPEAAHEPPTEMALPEPESADEQVAHRGPADEAATADPAGEPSDEEIAAAAHAAMLREAAEAQEAARSEAEADASEQPSADASNGEPEAPSQVAVAPPAAWTPEDPSLLEVGARSIELNINFDVSSAEIPIIPKELLQAATLGPARDGPPESALPPPREAGRRPEGPDAVSVSAAPVGQVEPVVTRRTSAPVSPPAHPPPPAQPPPPARTSPELKQHVASIAPPSRRMLGLDAPSEDSIRKVVDRLIGGDGGDTRAAQHELHQLGPIVLPQLMEKFPGPTADPFAPADELPEFAACGPLVWLLGELGRDAHPYVSPRLEARVPAERFYATYFYSEVIVPDIVPKLLRRLHDEERSISKLAIRVLRQYKGEESFDLVHAHLLERLESPSVDARKSAADFIAMFRHERAVPALISIFEKREKPLYDAARRALEEITKQSFGTSARKWGSWWNAHRDEPRVQWLIDGLDARDRKIRDSAFEELQAATKMTMGYDVDAPKRQREDAKRRWQSWHKRNPDVLAH